MFLYVPHLGLLLELQLAHSLYLPLGELNLFLSPLLNLLLFLEAGLVGQTGVLSLSQLTLTLPIVCTRTMHTIHRE